MRSRGSESQNLRRSDGHFAHEQWNLLMHSGGVQMIKMIKPFPEALCGSA
jgi:hypothetical protein